MRKLLSILLCVLLVLAFTACAGDAVSQQDNPGSNDPTRPSSDPEKSLQGIISWYGQTVGSDDYDLFQSHFGDIITKEELHELYKLEERTKCELNACILRTLSDGTRVLLVLEMEDGYWEEFRIKSIEILD